MSKDEHRVRDKPASDKDITAGVIAMRIYLIGLIYSFDFNWHEIEEVVKRAMFEVEEMSYE